MGNFIRKDWKEIARIAKKSITSKSGQALSWSLEISLLFSLYIFQTGTNAVFVAINTAYDQSNKRGFKKIAIL